MWRTPPLASEFVLLPHLFCKNSDSLKLHSAPLSESHKCLTNWSYTRIVLSLNLYLVRFSNSRCRRLDGCLTCFFHVPVCLSQLPHMPHISECLMKRSLKPTDLRDMTLGQLQVIVNDLHSQIESELTAQTLQTDTDTYSEWLASAFVGRNEQDRKWGKNVRMHTDP